MIVNSSGTRSNKSWRVTRWQGSLEILKRSAEPDDQEGGRRPQGGGQSIHKSEKGKNQAGPRFTDNEKVNWDPNGTFQLVFSANIHTH